MAECRLGLMLGDGIGPEIVPGAADLVKEAAGREGLGIDWIELPMGRTALDDHGDPVPPETKQALAACDGWLMGPHDFASYPCEWREQPGHRPPAGELRHHFDLYANVRPSRAFVGVDSVAPEMDLIVIRENSEGFLADRNMYSGIGEFEPVPGVALCVGVFTEAAVERVIRRGFELARSRRRHIAVAHKSGPLPLTLGLYKSMVHQVATDYPDVDAIDIHADTLAAALVRDPARFDVIVAENLLGDILSDLASELAGSPGFASSINIGDEHAMASAAHGSAPDIAGQGVANPLGVILAGALLLRWLAATRESPAAGRAQLLIENAVAAAVADDVRTPDMGGSASTAELLAAVREGMS